jgi:hypothetical protein
MAPGQSSSARRPPPLRLVGLRAATFTPPLGQRNLQSVVPPDNPLRRVGLMRPHGSSLVGGINNIFSGGSTAGTSSGRGVGTSSGSGAGTANGAEASHFRPCGEWDWAVAGSYLGQAASSPQTLHWILAAASASTPLQPSSSTVGVAAWVVIWVCARSIHVSYPVPCLDDCGLL